MTNFLTDIDIYPIICNLLAWVIIILGCGIGGFCYARLCVDLWDESHELDEGNPLRVDFYAGKEPHLYALELHNLLKRRAEERRKKPWWRGHGTLIDERVQMMIILSLKRQFRDRAQALPALDALRTHTTEIAEGGKASAFLSVTASSLLILGIGGTLYGVHASLANQVDENIHLLLHAFKPGVCAVFSTVILSLLSGLRNKLLLQVLTKLDRYTLDTLIPCLQPNSALELTSGELASPISTFSNHIRSLRHSGEELQNQAESLHQLSQEHQLQRKDFTSLLDTAETNLNILRARHTVLQNASDLIQTRCKQLQAYCEDEKEQTERLCNLIRSISQNLTFYSDRYKNLKKILEDVRQKQDAAMAALGENAPTMPQADTFQAAQLNHLLAAQEALLTAESLLHARVKKFAAASGLAYNLLHKVHQKLLPAFTGLERIHEELQHFRETLRLLPEQIREMILKALAELRQATKQSKETRQSIMSATETSLFSKTELIAIAAMAFGSILHYLFLFI